MTRNSEELLDRNLERLIRRWADPVVEERISQARQTFTERATSSAPAESRSLRRWGVVATAAGLLLCAAVFGSLFLVDSGNRHVAQADAAIQALINDLAHPDVAKRDRAAAELRALGAKARPPLEQAVKGPSADLRVRAQDVLDRIAAGKDAGGSVEAELEKQRALVGVLDAECTQKAVRINELQRQLAAAKADGEVFIRQLEAQVAQIVELQKQVAELRKK